MVITRHGQFCRQTSLQLHEIVKEDLLVKEKMLNNEAHKGVQRIVKGSCQGSFLEVPWCKLTGVVEIHQGWGPQCPQRYAQAAGEQSVETQHGYDREYLREQ